MKSALCWMIKRIGPFKSALKSTVARIPQIKYDLKFCHNVFVTVLSKSFNSATLNKHTFVLHPCDRTVRSPQFLNWRWETTAIKRLHVWDLRSAKSWQFILWVITPCSLVGSYPIFRKNVLPPPPGSQIEKLPWHAVVTNASADRLNQQTTV